MANQDETLPGQPVSVSDAGPAGMRRIAPKREPGQPQFRPKRGRGLSVRALKVLLPLVMVVTVGYLIYWWFEARGTVVDPRVVEQVPQDTKAEVTVNDVKYDGKDKKGRPYSITADSASHADGDDRHISLKKPMADIIMASGAYVALTANDGVLDRDADIVTLDGDVTLFHDNGLSFQTASATIHLKDKTAEGSAPVEGQNGDGELTSQGFRVLDDGDTIEFTGKAYMKIYPKNKDQGG
ncbi:MAG TPA: LPS export ABC transporter periplasmic protein LptC [Dongiaceae bacterium]|jgi:lipopolysaccharide export system protein LptC